jgi:hypothetical protein
MLDPLTAGGFTCGRAVIVIFADPGMMPIAIALSLSGS